MRVVTVGTGTVVPDPQRASACLWVERGPERAVFDCGAGAVQGLARAGLPWGEVTHLFLSHFHADHLGDVPALLFALRHGLLPVRTATLRVFGPVGTRSLFRRWAQALGDWLLDPGFPVPVGEVGPEEVVPVGEATVRAHPTPHTAESVAYRIDAPEGSVGYTGDTGPSEELGRFFEGVDLLIAECSLPDNQAIDNHLSPARVARLAARARPGTLVVTHVYPQLRTQDVPALVREAGYAGRVVHAADGMEFHVEGSARR